MIFTSSRHLKRTDGNFFVLPNSCWKRHKYVKLPYEIKESLEGIYKNLLGVEYPLVGKPIY